MTQFGDSDDRQNVPLEPERPPFGGFDTTSMLVGTLLGTALGGVLGWLSKRPRTDDEPPIRVKGGSIPFLLVHRAIYWIDDGGKKVWKLSGGEKSPNERYAARVTITYQGASTTKWYHDVKTVRVRYGGPGFIELKSVGKHTKLKALEELTQGSDSQTIIHQGEISEIQLDPGGVVYLKQDGAVEMWLYDE
jgi:hypothetical protein